MTFTRSLKFITALALAALLVSSTASWGFYSHKLINRMAVFTLPAEMIDHYKPFIDRIESDAVNADKRRYASEFEAIRHYIDLDHWGETPFDTLPRNWSLAIGKFTRILCYSPKDSVRDITPPMGDTVNSLWVQLIMDHYYSGERWLVDCDTLSYILSEDVDCANCREIELRDHVSEHGVLPYHLQSMQNRLKRAFESGDEDRILSLSADIGHYIADAHVPLHTTVNYNGQLTGQDGIHAFWESRIPELFAEDWDFLVGRAHYIEDPRSFYWSIVLESHALKDSVLIIEKRLAAQFPKDQQYCFDPRGSVMSFTECEKYARAFDREMDGMVEQRMRDAILAIGSSWYTAWIDAGKPQALARN